MITPLGKLTAHALHSLWLKQSTYSQRMLLTFTTDDIYDKVDAHTADIKPRLRQPITEETKQSECRNFKKDKPCSSMPCPYYHSEKSLGTKPASVSPSPDHDQKSKSREGPRMQLYSEKQRLLIQKSLSLFTR